MEFLLLLRSFLPSNGVRFFRRRPSLPDSADWPGLWQTGRGLRDGSPGREALSAIWQLIRWGRRRARRILWRHATLPGGGSPLPLPSAPSPLPSSALSPSAPPLPPASSVVCEPLGSATGYVLPFPLYYFLPFLDCNTCGTLILHASPARFFFLVYFTQYQIV